jgi:tetratricopeptide (TPR) repeat protein
MTSRNLCLFVCLAVCALTGLFVLSVADPDAWQEFLPALWDFPVLILVLSCCLVLFFDPRVRHLVRRRLTSSGQALERNDAGIALVHQGGYVAAIGELSEAIRLNPHLPAAYINRGAAYCQLEKWDEALADLEHGLRLAPALADGYAWRSMVWQYQGDFERALRDLDEAIRLEPSHLSARAGRAALLLARGDLDKALADVDHVLIAGAADGVVMALRASILLQKGDCDRAIDQYTEVLLRGLEPPPDLFRDRGLAWHLKGHQDRAIADLNEAIRLDAKDGLAFNNRGAAHTKKGDYAHARADLEQAIRLSPELPHAHKNLAWLLATCPQAEFRDGGLAVQHARKALDLVEEKVADWLPIMAAACAEAGDFDEAVRWQGRFLAESAHPPRESALRRLELYQARLPCRACASRP